MFVSTVDKVRCFFFFFLSTLCFFRFFNTIIILAVVTTLPIPSLVRMVVEKGKVAFENADAEAPRVVKDEELL